MNPEEKIRFLRNEIDDFDDEILDLLIKRFDVSKQIGHIKSSHNLNVGDPNRENQIIKRLSERWKGILTHEDIAAIFGPIYDISKKIQRE